MNCQSAELLIQLSLDGALTTAERGELDLHLDRCEACAKAFTEFRSLARTAARWAAPVHAGQPDISAYVAAILQEARTAPQLRDKTATPWSWALGAWVFLGALYIAGLFVPVSLQPSISLPGAPHPMDFITTMTAAIRLLPADAAQTLQFGMAAAPSDLKWGLIAGAAILVNGAFILRSIAVERSGGNGAGRAHG